MKENNKKLLFIFPRPPYPCVGGDKLRMYQNIIFLSKHYTIDIVFINDEITKDENIKELKKYAGNVINFDVSKTKCYLNTIIGFFSKKPLQVHYYYHKKVKNWIDKNINNYDYVFCTTIRTTEYIKEKKISKIVDFVDAISLNYQKAIKKSGFGIWKLMYKIDSKRLPIYEKSILPFFNKKIIISKIDKSFILKNTNHTDLKVIPNSVLIENLPVDIKSGFNISFIGKMDYEPNINAVIHFTNNIFPIITRKFPKLQFNIVGYRPTKKVLNLQKHKNVNVLGYVDNIYEHILKSKVIVAPMISGAGVQNKILQSMYLKKCVITSSIGAEGLTNIKNNSEIIIVDDAVSFAKKVIEMLENDTDRETIATNAKNYINRNYSKEIVAAKLINYLNS